MGGNREFLKRRNELIQQRTKIEEYKSARCLKQLSKPRTSKKKLSSSAKRKRQESISSRQERHFKMMMKRKAGRRTSLQCQEKKRRESQFREKMKDKFAFVGTKFGKMTKASMGKQRDKFDASIQKPKGGVVLPGNIVRISGKAIPHWRQI